MKKTLIPWFIVGGTGALVVTGVTIAVVLQPKDNDDKNGALASDSQMQDLLSSLTGGNGEFKGLGNTLLHDSAYIGINYPEGVIGTMPQPGENTDVISETTGANPTSSQLASASVNFAEKASTQKQPKINLKWEDLDLDHYYYLVSTFNSKNELIATKIIGNPKGEQGSGQTYPTYGAKPTTLPLTDPVVKEKVEHLTKAIKAKVHHMAGWYSKEMAAETNHIPEFVEFTPQIGDQYVKKSGETLAYLSTDSTEAMEHPGFFLKTDGIPSKSDNPTLTWDSLKKTLKEPKRGDILHFYTQAAIDETPNKNIFADSFADPTWGRRIAESIRAIEPIPFTPNTFVAYASVNGVLTPHTYTYDSTAHIWKDEKNTNVNNMAQYMVYEFINTPNHSTKLNGRGNNSPLQASQAFTEMTRDVTAADKTAVESNAKEITVDSNYQRPASGQPKVWKDNTYVYYSQVPGGAATSDMHANGAGKWHILGTTTMVDNPTPVMGDKLIRDGITYYYHDGTTPGQS